MSREVKPISPAPTVTVIYADAQSCIAIDVPWHPQLTVAEALRLAPAVVAAAADLGACGIGVWGVAVAHDALLAPNDRVEIVPPLPNDPKEARRQRVLEAKHRRRGSSVDARSVVKPQSV